MINSLVACKFETTMTRIKLRMTFKNTINILCSTESINHLCIKACGVGVIEVNVDLERRVRRDGTPSI